METIAILNGRSLSEGCHCPCPRRFALMLSFLYFVIQKNFSIRLKILVEIVTRKKVGRKDGNCSGISLGTVAIEGYFHFETLKVLFPFLRNPTKLIGDFFDIRQREEICSSQL
jgi:hypothetical protein